MAMHCRPAGLSTAAKQGPSRCSPFSTGVHTCLTAGALEGCIAWMELFALSYCAPINLCLSYCVAAAKASPGSLTLCSFNLDTPLGR